MQIFQRGTKTQIENELQFMPKFDESGLIPAIAVDKSTGKVLMLAYMNLDSLLKTSEIGEAVYYSRSRQELWHKGATSGQIQVVHEIQVDCDQDCLILIVDQKGEGACHTGAKTCFYRSLSPEDGFTKMAKK